MRRLGLPETCWDRPRCKCICWDWPQCKAHSITVADSSKPSRTMADSSKTQQRNKRSNEALARRRHTAFSERCSMAAPTQGDEESFFKPSGIGPQIFRRFYFFFLPGRCTYSATPPTRASNPTTVVKKPYNAGTASFKGLDIAVNPNTAAI